MRRKLGKGESISEDIKPFDQIFLGDLHGVVLREQGRVFEIIVEDDGRWHPYHSDASSFYLDDLLMVVIEAKQWRDDENI